MPLPTFSFRTRLRTRVRAIACVCIALFAQGVATSVPADADVLGECVALSGVDDDVHACLDNYLDVTDERIGQAVGGVRETLSGEPLVAFERAQSAFERFRRDNCLWYLAFNAPRTEAEKIAKGCLARLSLQRLVELQGLLVVDGGTVFAFDGHYVFDATRNSFQPCGSARRFWVDGDDVAVASLQQQYLERTTDEGQRLFARVDGALVGPVEDRAGHVGRLRLDRVEELRMPRASDCRLPGGAPSVQPTDDAGADPVTPLAQRLGDGDADESSASTADLRVMDAVAPDNPVADPDTLDVRRDERLTAYFGAWLAECEAKAGGATCGVAVDFDGTEGALPVLTLVRDGGDRTGITLALPPDAATTADQVRWRVDDVSLGVIDGARLRQGDDGVELAMLDQRFVDERLLPLLRRGYTLHIDTLGDGTNRRATLVGLSRALAFADDFIDAGN